jgi:hypothetical protein
MLCFVWLASLWSAWSDESGASMSRTFVLYHVENVELFWGQGYLVVWQRKSYFNIF